MHRFFITMAILLVMASPAHAVKVGWSVDIHQNQFQPCADDFHVWGVLESMPGPNGPVPPVLSEQDSLAPLEPATGGTCNVGPFDNFTYQIGGPANPNLPKPQGYVGTWPPIAPPFYYFEANWSSDDTCVSYCNWAHFGLEFEVNDANYGYWLQGKWTLEHTEYAQYTTPMIGFSVTDGSDAKLRLGNANAIQLGVGQVELLALPVGMTDFDINNLSNEYFDANPGMVWSPVPGGIVPQYMAPDSFFDVFLESVPVAGQPGQNFGNLQPGQILLARQSLNYNAAQLGVPGGVQETFWQYEMHGVSSIPEPSTIVMLLCAVGTMLFIAKQKNK